MGRDGIDGGRDRERDRDEDGFFEGGDGRRNLVILGIPWDSLGFPGITDGCHGQCDNCPGGAASI